MTNDKITLHTLLEKTSDASLLRDMITFAAERLMALETEPLCGAAPGERSADRVNQRNGYRDRDWHTRAGTVELVDPRCGQPRNFATAATFRGSSSRAAWPKRRSRR